MENPVKYASRIYKKCEICDKRRIPQSGIFLARFPLEPARCRMWVKAVGLEDLIYVPIEKLHELKFICGQHFKPENFNTKGNRLCKSAIPTLKLRYPPLSDELLVDFPLHMKSLQKENVQTGVFRKFANIMESVKVKQPSKENMETQVVTFTLMPSTSTHGEKSQAIFGGTRTYNKHRVEDAPQKPTPGVSISEDTEDMDFVLDENITTDLVTMESLSKVPDVAGPFTWQNPSEVIDSDDENDAQYIDTKTMTDDVLLYNDDDHKPSTINICEITNQDVSTNEKQLQYHKEYKCNHCSGPIAGFRYRCVQCADYDLCAACEALGAHERHYVLRIPGPRPNAEIDGVLERIRNELMAMNNSVLLEDAHMLDSMKEEIKDELDDPLSEKETRESYEDERMDHMSTTYQSGDSNGLDDYQSDNDQSHSEQTESDTDKEYTVEDNEDTTSEISNCNHINKRALRSGLKNSESPKRTLTTSPIKQTISNVGSTQQRRYTNRKFNSTRNSHITSKLGDTNVITIKHNHTGFLK